MREFAAAKRLGFALTAALFATVVVVPIGAASGASATAQFLPTITVSGTVTDESGTTPVAHACIYPIFQQQVTGTSSLPGPYYIQQVLAPTCTSADGTYSLQVPPAAAGGLNQAVLLVIPPNKTMVSQLSPFADSGATNFGLAAATASAHGAVTLAGSQLQNAIVVVQSATTGEIYGAAVTGADGTWSAGTALAVSTTAAAGALGLPGSDWSPDIYVGAVQSASVSPGVDTAYPTIALPDLATVTGTVSFDGNSAHSWQLINVSCKSLCSQGMLAQTDAAGHFSISVPAGSRVSIGAGGSIFDRTLGGGTTQLPAIRTVPKGALPPLNNDIPVTWLSPATAVNLTGTTTMKWWGASVEAAPYQFDRAVAKATYKSTLTSYSKFASDNTQSHAITLKPGATECDQVRTTTGLGAGSASPVGLPATSCQTMPLDDRSLSASSKWKRTASASAYLKTITTTSVKGQTLTVSGVTGHRLALVWAGSSKGGAVSITVAGKVLVKAFSTVGSTSGKHVSYLPARAMKGAKIVLTTTSSKPVSIDGLAVLP